MPIYIFLRGDGGEEEVRMIQERRGTQIEAITILKTLKTDPKKKQKIKKVLKTK